MQTLASEHKAAAQIPDCIGGCASPFAHCITHGKADAVLQVELNSGP